MKKNRSDSLKKYHKWPGVIIAFLLIYFAVSGILMNHRNLISGININRNLLPKEYRYKNWNLAALKGNQIISKDSILIYGNIGVWLTDSNFTNFTGFNTGFPKGIDHRKIFDIHQTSNKNLYAATLFGLYCYNYELKQWQKLPIKSGTEKFVAVISKGDTLLVMSRSFIYKGFDKGLNTEFTKIQLKAPANYKNKIGLFKTIWQIHSGEIFGLPGKLFADFIGLLIIILSVTGIIYFLFPKWIKKRKQKGKSTKNLAKTNKLSLKWHNKIGAWFIFFLIISALTGMFLSPPLLLTIVYSDIPKLKFTHLDQENPWYDDLRDLFYDEKRDVFILAGYQGLYELKTLYSIPKLYDSQPPISVMGINAFEKFDQNTFLIGSFSGLFIWNPQSPYIYDFISGQAYQGSSYGKPFGSYAITGLLNIGYQNTYIVDYSNGILFGKNSTVFPKMPEEIIAESPISLWNLCLEIHTGRIFHFMISDFYILIVPLSGIISLIVILSGYFLYRKKKKRIARSNN